MKGVVLCGGQSKRMGADKGLLVEAGKAWVEIAFANLSEAQITILLSINKRQVELYSQMFSADQLVIDDESLPVKGPLLGLLSVHQQFPDENLLVLAVDMINMRKNVLQKLLKTYEEEAFEAFVFTVAEKVQPLCGIYASGGLKQILELASKNQLRKFSMTHALECINTKYVSADAFGESFINFNSAEDVTAGRL